MQEPATIVSQPRRPSEKSESASRLYLWIDGVGGFLVCLNTRVTLGHASPDSGVDVPVMADLSHHHANLLREGSLYYLEAVRSVKLGDQTIDKAFLRDGELLTLGNSCQFRFRLPVPASASARLDLVSGQRFSRAVQGVLLMADTLVLGPGNQVHVAVPDWKNLLILVRGKNGFEVRGTGQFTMGGKAFCDRVPVVLGAPIVHEETALTLEEA